MNVLPVQAHKQARTAMTLNSDEVLQTEEPGRSKPGAECENERGPGGDEEG